TKRTQWLSGGPGSGNGARSFAGRVPRTNPASVSMLYVSKRVPEPAGRESPNEPSACRRRDETKPIGPGAVSGRWAVTRRNEANSPRRASRGWPRGRVENPRTNPATQKTAKAGERAAVGTR